MKKRLTAAKALTVRPRRTKNLWITLGAGVLISAFLFVGVVCNFQFDLKIPLNYEHDALFGMGMFKGLAEGQWFPYFGIHDQNLGAPFGMDMGDYPSSDNLHLLIVKLLSVFSKDPVVLYNAYYFLGYLLTTATMISACFYLGFPALLSLNLGIFYAFLPFHLLRYQHIYLASYYLLPWLGVIFLWCWQKKPLLFNWKSGKTRFALLLSFLIGMSGVYFSFFYCFFLLLASTSAALTRKSKIHFYSGLVLIFTVLGSLGLCAVVFVFHKMNLGDNPAATWRASLDAELYGLRLISMVLPRAENRIGFLAELRSAYHPLVQGVEGLEETVGLIGVFGIILLVLRLFFLKGKTAVADRLSFLWIFGFLLATLAGVSELVFAYLTPLIRAYNRIGIFLALFGLFGVGYFFKGLRTRVSQKAWLALMGGLLILGVYDQVTPDFAEAQERISQDYSSDKKFIEKIETLLPAGSQIVQIPFVAFPESPPIGDMQDYSHLKAYLHSHQLKWSYGAMKGRRESEEIQKASSLPLSPFLLHNLGYRGVYIDRTAFKDRAQQLESELTRQLGATPWVSENQKLSFFTLPQ